MKLRVSQILIGDLKFDYLNEVEITKTWKNLTDTCMVRLPRRYNSILKNQKTVTLDKVLKTGEGIEVKLGYDFDFKTRFNGYLKTIKPNFPIELEAEDEMYKWKRTKVKLKSFRGGDVASILEHIGIQKYKLFGDKITIGDFLITEEMATVARVLEKLKEASGLPIFLRKGIIHVGGQYDPNPKNRTTHKFIIGKTIISHSLEYKLKEDNPIQVTVISKQNDGSEVKVQVPEDEPSGATKHTFQANPNIKDKNALQKLGYAFIDKTSYTGWRGSITVFGEPMVEHGDIIELEDMDEGIIKGQYFADLIKVKAGYSSAYTQEIELGQIVI